VRATPGAPPIDTRFLVDRAMALPEVVAEVDASHAIAARYLHGHELVQQVTRQGGEQRLRYPLRDGLGSSLALADGAGTITDRYRYTPWGTDRISSGDTATAHRYAGEMWEREIGLSYNRARWYAPAQGRFTQMDVFAGFATDPRSMHKYGYVHGDPVNGTDPSGYFSLGEVTLSQRVAITLLVTAVVLDNNGAFMATAASNAFTTQAQPNYSNPAKGPEVRMMAIQGGASSAVRNRGYSGYPLIIFGDDVLQATAHYRDVIADNPVLALLNRKYPANDRTWIRRSVTPCTGRTGGSTGMDCDEYPFNASSQGGESNYRLGIVSLRPVRSDHNQSAGRDMLQNKLYGPCGMKNGDAYGVIPAPSVPTSFAICGNGRVVP
jgi:RHS repeat-associated protein